MTEQTSCTVFLIGRFKPNARESPEFLEYSKRSNANGEAHGGVVTRKHGIVSNAGSGPKPDFLIEVQYPSEQQATSAFNSSEYLQIVPLRDAVFSEVQILIAAG